MSLRSFASRTSTRAYFEEGVLESIVQPFCNFLDGEAVLDEPGKRLRRFTGFT
jgi:hypothetical protein